MPLENILQSIEQRKATEMERITASFEVQMRDLEKITKKKIQEIVNDSARQSAEECRSLENKELSNAEIEARKLVWEKRAQLVEENLTKAFDFMKNVRSSKSYKKMITDMVDLARKKLGDGCTVTVNEADASLLKGVKGITVRMQDIDPYGGLIAESRDGSREMDLTVTTMMKDLRDGLSLELYERIGAK